MKNNCGERAGKESAPFKTYRREALRELDIC